MGFLTNASFTQKRVQSRRMLKAGGGVGPGGYTRRAKNVISSPGLLHRITKEVPAAMAACALPDHCTPLGKPEMANRSAPDGKSYRLCSDEERIRRLEGARECGHRNLASGIVISPPKTTRVARGRREDVLAELGL